MATCTRAHTYTHTHTHTQACTHAHTRMHVREHQNIHTCKYVHAHFSLSLHQSTLHRNAHSENKILWDVWSLQFPERSGQWLNKGNYKDDGFI